MTNEDIDAIIEKGVRDTEQLNQKLQEFSKDAMKFTMVRPQQPVHLPSTAAPWRTWLTYAACGCLCMP